MTQPPNLMNLAWKAVISRLASQAKRAATGRFCGGPGITTSKQVRANGRRKTGESCTVRPMSDKPPQTYILHTVAIAIVLATAMVIFLFKAWG